MPAVIVPPRAGVLSAAGILGAPRQVDIVSAWHRLRDHAAVADALDKMVADALHQLGVPDRGGVTVATALDCRYAGQSHELTVPDVASFADEHRRRNGYARPGAPVEVVALRVSARIPSPVCVDDLPPSEVDRKPCRGPSVIVEPDCTIWIPEGWRGDVHPSGSLVVTRG
jgi:N-methylhydantoinase A/oxoprolinase/acetone carboxylase beta subunit